jgi:hypothetical protein
VTCNILFYNVFILRIIEWKKMIKDYEINGKDLVKGGKLGRGVSADVFRLEIYKGRETASHEIE